MNANTIFAIMVVLFLVPPIGAAAYCYNKSGADPEYPVVALVLIAIASVVPLLLVIIGHLTGKQSRDESKNKP